MELVERVRAATGLANAAFLVGEYVNGARLAVVPLDFRPPPADVWSGRRRRLARAAAGGMCAWFALSALAGSAMESAAAMERRARAGTAKRKERNQKPRQRPVGACDT